MQRVKQLGYVGIHVTDRSAWREFATNILGLEWNAARSDDATDRYRLDEYAVRMLVADGESDDIAYAGWEVAHARDFDALVAQVAAAGYSVTAATEAEKSSRCVRDMSWFEDADGFRHEIYHGAEVAYQQTFNSPQGVTGFVTGDQGIGHIVLGVADLAGSMDFYLNVLGMRESDYITITRGEMVLDLGFLHCNPRHHTVALAQAKRPKRCFHLMFQVERMDDVGLAYDRCLANGTPVNATLGRHTNDHMLSFYMASPSGFEVEYGYGARVVDDATWQVQHHNAPSIWGHKRG